MMHTDVVLWFFIPLAVGFLCIIPSFVLMRYFIATKIRDYFIFSLVFFSAAFNQWIISLEHQHLLSPKMVIISRGITHLGIVLMIALHLSLLEWDTIINPFFSIGSLMVLTNLGFITSFWLKPNLVVFGFSLASTTFSHINLSVWVYRLYVCFVGMWIYFKLDMEGRGSHVERARTIYIIALLFFTVIPITGLLENFNILPFLKSYANIGNLLTIIMIASITIFYPYGVLISHAQISHALNLYNKVKEKTKKEKEQQQFGTKAMDGYLEAISERFSDKLTNGQIS